MPIHQTRGEEKTGPREAPGSPANANPPAGTLSPLQDLSRQAVTFASVGRCPRYGQPLRGMTEAIAKTVDLIGDSRSHLLALSFSRSPLELAHWDSGTRARHGVYGWDVRAMPGATPGSCGLFRENGLGLTERRHLSHWSSAREPRGGHKHGGNTRR